MSNPIFKITEHTVECQHIREWPRATASLQDEILHMAVKQYTPLNNLDPQTGDVTIIAMTANATPKEAYEPLWEDLVLACLDAGIGIRNIWIADVSHQGSSYLLNEKLVGNDPHWFDTSRDYLHMINQFRSQMIRPMIGIGHSLSTAQLVHLSYIHPRLLHSLVLMEAVFQASMSPAHEAFTSAMARRKDVWPSREAAETSLRENPAYRNWDGRAMRKMIETSFRDLPALSHDSPSQHQQGRSKRPWNDTDSAVSKEVTLVTTKHQQALSMLRSNPSNVDVKTPATLEQKTTHPDIPAHMETHIPGLYRSEMRWAFDALPSLRPSVLYLYGARSPVWTQESNKERMDQTGNGFCGSGGAEFGLVRDEVLEGDHYLPCENVKGCAESIKNWMGTEVARWWKMEAAVGSEFEGKSLAERQSMDSVYLEKIKALNLSSPVKSRISKL